MFLKQWSHISYFSLSNVRIVSFFLNIYGFLTVYLTKQECAFYSHNCNGHFSLCFWHLIDSTVLNYYSRSPFIDVSLLNIAASISRLPQHVMVVNEPSNVTLQVTCCSPVAQWKTCDSIIHLSQERPSGSSQLTVSRRSYWERARRSRRERERERVREELECLGKKWRGSEWGKRDVRAARSEKHSHGGWTQCNQMQECCLSHFLLWRTLLNQPHLTGLVFGERDYLISVFNIKHLSGQVSCEATTLESKNCLFASD